MTCPRSDSPQGTKSTGVIAGRPRALQARRRNTRRELATDYVLASDGPSAASNLLMYSSICGGEGRGVGRLRPTKGVGEYLVFAGSGADFADHLGVQIPLYPLLYPVDLS